ncbi:diaminopimelate decarboxylase [Plasticicumulans acidivorans]|uniref:Diaminopimelate decarboxylase n=1 Tax=Plasticicumulans acidivorans TaxID=886464 RepID=A0A317N409_9GAMM|nr:diaminopimelate decarboxylase [Plasticicumulans acidivorans]PWV64897.1 diaminopimelate decarboxylase [Plasticicumulans acidivorans]
MDHFEYRDGALYAEDVAVAELAARFGTPLYIYSRATLERHFRVFDAAFGSHPHLVCYSVKANSNLGVLSALARLGSGFDIVSVGELERVLAAGGEPGKVVFSGVGKREDEMVRALDVGIRCFNAESEAELERLQAVAARLGKRAPISLRVNPDVDAKTHPYISTGLKENKFGIAIADALAVYSRAAAMPNLEIVGVDCHIGSQLTQLTPFTDALDRLLALIARLEAQGIHLRHIDLGGGIGIRYSDETPPHPDEYAAAVLAKLAELPYEICIEPGRAIVGNAGLLVTRVELLKLTADKNFVVVDAAMNDLIRPSLYSAWMDIVPVDARLERPRRCYDVVGPICETGDFLGKQRTLGVEAGDLLAVRSAGAYGFSMASNYNSRPRAAEVMVDGEQVHLVRERESVTSLFAGEQRLP